MLDALDRGRARTSSNTDFDTGKPSVHGEYRLADETYAELLDRLADREVRGVRTELRENIAAYYATAPQREAEPERAEAGREDPRAARQARGGRGSAGREI